MNTFQKSATRMIMMAILSSVLVFYVGIDLVESVYASQANASLSAQLRQYGECVKTRKTPEQKRACNHEFRTAYDHLMKVCYAHGGAGGTKEVWERDACERRYGYMEDKRRLAPKELHLLSGLKKDVVAYEGVLRKLTLESGLTKKIEHLTYLNLDGFLDGKIAKIAIPVYERNWDKATCGYCYFLDFPVNPLILNRYEARMKIPEKLKKIKDQKERNIAIESYIALEMNKFYRSELLDRNGKPVGKLHGMVVKKNRDTYTVQSHYDRRSWMSSDWATMITRGTSGLACVFGFLDKFIKVRSGKALNDVLGLFGKVAGCGSFVASNAISIPGLWVVRKVTFH